MRPWPKILGLALALAGASCGKLASGSFQPLPIATVRGVVTFPATATEPPDGGLLTVLVVWQPVDWLPDPADVLLQANPLTSDDGPTCPRPDPSCGWSGQVACTVRYGLADAVATIDHPGPGGSVEFEAPIYAVPPAAARHDLAARGGSGSLALGHLLFVGGPAGAAATDGDVFASSAFNGAAVATPPFTTAYRTSSYVAYVEGNVDSQECGEACGGGAGDLPPRGNPGVLGRLPPGFSLVLKLEEDDGLGRLVPVSFSTVSIDTRVAVNGYDADAGVVWCGELAIEQSWEGAPTASQPWARCSAPNGSLACDQATLRDGCRRLVTRFELEASCREPPAACVHPGTFEADDTSAPNAHRSFQPLPSGSVLAVASDQPTDPERRSMRTALYDVATRSWWPADALGFPRGGATATRLLSGEVLVTGGSTGDDDSRTAELFEPATGTWTRTASMRSPRSDHAATLLPSGEVLVTGGSNVEQPEGTWEAELYDPVQGTWLPIDLGTSGPPLARHAALLLPGTGGSVLVTGADGGPEAFLCEVWKDGLIVLPSSGCRATAAMNVAHREGTFTVLSSGRVLALGGREEPTSAEVFDPETESWTRVAPMLQGRTSHAAAVLAGGEVLVAGGEATDGGELTTLASAELYDPEGNRWTSTGALAEGRSALTLVPSPSGGAIALGGHTATTSTLPVEHYCPPDP